MTARMTEKEAIERGIIQPPGPDPLTEERAKRLALEAINRHRSRFSARTTSVAFITCLISIVGWVLGFACALLLNPTCRL